MIDREKVIKALECCAYKQNCIECPYYKGNSTCMDDKDKDALELLKEQEAVEPNVIIDTFVCGNCGTRLERQSMVGDNILFTERFDYCPHCGREVKWDDIR